MQTNVTLCVKDALTTIPYPAAEREDTSHQGFILLKGRPEEAGSVPAAQESEAIKLALVRINGSSTPFFSVGCHKMLNSQNGSFWTRGYIEFALNYEEVVRDSPNYFLLFEQFANHVNTAQFDLPVDFSFELRPAEFTTSGIKGHTTCVWITTAEFPAEEGADKAWNQSINFLSEFLGSFEKLELPEIYQG